MISKENRLYYIDPVQRPALGITASAPGQIVALRYRRGPHFKQDRIGTVITTDRMVVEQGQLWWVDDEGDYVYGAPISINIDGYQPPVMHIVDDDLFVVGVSAGSQDGVVHMFLTQRSDNKRFDGLPSRHVTYSDKPVRAAEWARELMPEAGDTQAVVDKKVEIARLKWEQRNKKARVYVEGMERGWLNHLQEVRDDGHDMPEPTFQLGVAGVALVPQRFDESSLERVAEHQRTVLTQVQNATQVRTTATGSSSAMVSYVGVPFSTITSAQSNSQGEIMGMHSSSLNNRISIALGLSGTGGTQFVEHARFPVLTHF